MQRPLDLRRQPGRLDAQVVAELADPAFPRHAGDEPAVGIAEEDAVRVGLASGGAGGGFGALELGDPVDLLGQQPDADDVDRPPPLTGRGPCTVISTRRPPAGVAPSSCDQCRSLQSVSPVASTALTNVACSVGSATGPVFS